MRAILSGISLDGQAILDDVDDVDDDQGNTPLKNDGKSDNKEAISKGGQSKKDEKTGGYSPNDSPDSPDSPASKDELTKNESQNEKYFSGLKDEILNLIENEDSHIFSLREPGYGVLKYVG